MDSRAKILNSATDVFAEKGKHGTHLDEIALRAGVNKAMVYYYYSGKENLYREVLKNVLIDIHGRVKEAVNKIDVEDKDVVSAIEKVVRSHFRAFSSRPSYPKLIFGALVNEPQDILAVMGEIEEKVCPNISKRGTLSLLERGISERKLRKVDIRQTLISIMGMDMIYLIGKPIANSMLNLDIKNEEAFLKKRQDSIVDLLLYGIVERGRK